MMDQEVKKRKDLLLTQTQEMMITCSIYLERRYIRRGTDGHKERRNREGRRCNCRRRTKTRLCTKSRTHLNKKEAAYLTPKLTS